jgi:hypothetical protein
MKDQKQHPDDFASVSPSSFANAVGLRPTIVRELMDRKEVQHFVDADGKQRVWLDISRFCKHPVEPIDWTKAGKQDINNIVDEKGDATSE